MWLKPLDVCIYIRWLQPTAMNIDLPDESNYPYFSPTKLPDIHLQTTLIIPTSIPQAKQIKAIQDTKEIKLIQMGSTCFYSQMTGK